MTSFIIFPLGIHPIMKLIAVILATFGGCFISYEFLIRRIRWIGLLFGLKPKSFEIRNETTRMSSERIKI